MLLRSSSTPVLGSLLPSISESPNNNIFQPEFPNATIKNTPPSICNKHSLAKSRSPSSGKYLCQSSPLSPSVSNYGFRRVQSEGNLEELANSSFHVDEFSCMKPPKSRKPNSCMLGSTQSSMFQDVRDRSDDRESEGEEYQEESGVEGNGGFGLVNQLQVESLKQKDGASGNVCDGLRCEGEMQMYLARGLGISDLSLFNGDGPGGCGGGGNYRPVAFDKGGGDNHGISIEEHYIKMLAENPGNALFLRNYAQFLYKTKRDLLRAEEYYCRAILVDPGDGEILAQYATLVWELHRDKDRATNYFQRALQASSEDSHIHASYANFLWEIDDEEDQDHATTDQHVGSPLPHEGFMASAPA